MPVEIVDDVYDITCLDEPAGKRYRAFLFTAGTPTLFDTGLESTTDALSAGISTVGVDPVMMLTGPIPATREVLDKAGLELADMDTVEVNEAFASVPLAWMEEYPEYPYEDMNPNGGAIALGHPLGATGQKLIQTALNQLEDTGGQYGLVTMCIGFGQATATIIERV
jgi:acetyl-CoA acetyltransferase